MYLKNIVGTVLTVALIAFVGIPSGSNFDTASESNFASESCLNNGESAEYYKGYCCGGTYAVELQKINNESSNKFMCLSLRDHPIQS